MILWNDVFFSILCFSPLNSRSSTNVSCQSTQDFSDPDLVYDSGDRSQMPSPARARWIDAFNKVCAQFNGVGIRYELAYYKTNKMTCAVSEDTDQPGHPPGLVRVFPVHMKKPWVLSFPLSAQIRLHIHAGWTESSLGKHVILLVLSCFSWIISPPEPLGSLVSL